MNKIHKIGCVGSAALVSIWETTEPQISPFYGLGKWGGIIDGNDSAIITQELKRIGLDAKSILLNPTSADHTRVASLVGINSVVAVDEEEGPLTRSLCFEDGMGQRNWCFNRVPVPRSRIGLSEMDALYVDYYREFTKFLDEAFILPVTAEVLTFINLSSISKLSDVPVTAYQPNVVQASVPRIVGMEEARSLAGEIKRKMSARSVIVTMGERGAIMMDEAGTWCAVPEIRLDGCCLGAGAIFSSQVIIGIVSGLKRGELLDYAVNQTALRLGAWNDAARSRF